MKQAAPRHHKMKRLARKLKVWLPTAIGIMEAFWNSCEEFAYDGDVTKIEPETIAEWCNVDTIPHFEPVELVAAMIDSGFLDRVQNRLLIHDWPEHCTHYTHAKIARKRSYFADGSEPNLSQFWDRRIPRQELIEWYKNAGTRKAETGTRKAETGTRHVPATPKRVPVSPPPTPKPTPTPQEQLVSPGVSLVPDADVKELPAACLQTSNGHLKLTWPQAAGWMCKEFPRTDEAHAESLTVEIAAKCREAIQRAGGKADKFSDAAFVAVLKSARFPKQQSAAGFKRTAPAVAANWSKP